jgi:hypothetical protein
VPLQEQTYPLNSGLVGQTIDNIRINTVMEGNFLPIKIIIVTHRYHHHHHYYQNHNCCTVVIIDNFLCLKQSVPGIENIPLFFVSHSNNE